MAPYLKHLLAITPSILPSSSSGSAKSLLEKLEAKNATVLKELEEKLAEAEKTEGETEISDALRAKAGYLTKIGEKVRSTWIKLRSQVPFCLGTIDGSGLTAMTGIML